MTWAVLLLENRYHGFRLSFRDQQKAQSSGLQTMPVRNSAITASNAPEGALPATYLTTTPRLQHKGRELFCLSKSPRRCCISSTKRSSGPKSPDLLWQAKVQLDERCSCPLRICVLWSAFDAETLYTETQIGESAETWRGCPYKTATYGE